MRRFGLLLAVAACNPSGLTLEVVIDDPNIKKVELFAGERCSDDCPNATIAPSLPPMTVTRAYVVPDQEPWSVSEQDFEDGVAGFRLESSQDTAVGIVVVLGYDAQDQIRWSSTFHHVEIPTGDSAYWRVHLTSTTPIPATIDMQPAGTERIARWQQPTMQLPSCLLLEHWEGEATPTRELVVPAGDRDCDEVIETNECAPWIPNATAAAPTLDDASCVVLGSRAASRACVLGGPECNEDPRLPTDACVELAAPHCVSSGLCGCSGSSDPDGCIATKLNDGVNAGQIPFLKCVIQLDASGYACDSATLEADAGSYLSGGSTKCTAIQLNDLMTPLGAFSSGVAIDDTSKLKVESFTAPCKAELYFDGMSTPKTKLALARLALDNDNFLVVPARLDIKQGCAEPSHCDFFRPTVATTVLETIWDCVEPTNTVAACGPDPNATCDGPMCNGTCCGRGERCTANGCSCDGGAACINGDVCTVGAANPDQCGALCCGVTVLCPF